MREAERRRPDDRGGHATRRHRGAAYAFGLVLVQIGRRLAGIRGEEVDALVAHAAHSFFDDTSGSDRRAEAAVALVRVDGYPRAT